MAKTYVQASVKNGNLIRWTSASFPLKTYIAPFRWYRAKNEAHIYRQMVEDALNYWSRVSNGVISFQLVESLMYSQVNIDWKRVDRKALGCCHFGFDKVGRLYSAEVEIGLSDGILHADYMDKNEVYHTILHEIGHALGLGHSPYKQDMMYTPHQYGVITLSEGDIETINWLYNLKSGMTLEEICNNYKIKASNFDELISKIKQNKNSGSVNSKNNFSFARKDLLSEQDKISELKKYKMNLQNISISGNVQNYLKQSFINYNQGNKKK